MLDSQRKIVTTLIIMFQLFNTVVYTIGETGIRDLHYQCGQYLKGDTKLLCFYYPENCIQSKHPHYSCKVIVIVSKFNMGCVGFSHYDNYSRVLCSKRNSLYSFSIVRQLESSKMSCQNFSSVPLVDCTPLEYVAISISESSTLSDPDDVFYACVAEESHVTTWRDNGKTQVLKSVKIPNAYENKIFLESGVGVYWDDIKPLKETKFELNCHFLVSISPEDMEYFVEGKRKQLQLSGKKYVKLARGLVENTDFKEYNPNYKEVKTLIFENDEDTDSEISYFAEKQCNISELTLPPRIPIEDNSQNFKDDEKLREKYWAPVYENCRNRKKLCFAYKSGKVKPEQCYKTDSCDTLISFEALNNYRELNIVILVDNRAFKEEHKPVGKAITGWSALAFSLDVWMGNDVAFFCYAVNGSFGVFSSINNIHANKLGTDPLLTTLPYNIITNRSLLTEDKMYCSFTIPTKFNFSLTPWDNHTVLAFDLFKEEYFVHMASGRIINKNRIAESHRNSIGDRHVHSLKFSRATYELKVLVESSAIYLSGLNFVDIIWMTILVLYTVQYLLHSSM